MIIVVLWIVIPNYIIHFRLILIAEKDKVYKHFPTPLVNRMEKHFVSSKTVLNSSQRQLCELLEKWIEEITGSDRNR